jgi:histone deacetylase HOS3
MEHKRNDVESTLGSRDVQRQPRTAVYFQDLCYRHRYIRSRDNSLIFERPERLRAVKVGLAAALSRLEDLVTSRSLDIGFPLSDSLDASPSVSDESALVAALDRMSMNPVYRVDFPKLGLNIIQSGATIDILNHPAVKFIHGDIERDIYLENLVSWVKSSQDKISAGESEIPDGLSPTDLYRNVYSFLPVGISVC